MPRKPRLHVPGGIYHVILRGNGCQTIFYDADDRQRWESYIQSGVQRYQHRVHAYCWMTNHVHLAVQANVNPLSQFMAFVASQYARSTNRKMGRSGHLFERRYRAILVQSDSYLLELVRYIHLNPLRAGMIQDLTDYSWSSHAAYQGAACPDWLMLGDVLSQFGTTERTARQRYLEFMHMAQPEDTIRLLRNGDDDDSRVLGDDGWRREVLATAGAQPATTSLDDLVRVICNEYGVTEADLASRSRARAYSRIRARIALDASELGVATVTEVSRRFGRSQPGLSRAMNRLRANGQ